MKTDFIDSVSSFGNFADDSVSSKQDYIVPEPIPQPIPDNEVNPKAEELKSFGNFYKTNLAVKLQAAAPRDPSETARQAIEEIDNLPKPDKKGIPLNIPPEDRQGIYEGRIAEYNSERAKLADKAVSDSRPPSVSDYNYLPPHLRDAKYNEELINYNERIAELNQISLKSKQEVLKLDSQYQKLSPENKNLVNDSMIKNQASPKEVDTIVKLARSEGFARLDPKEQTKMLNYVGGTNKQLSQPARSELRKILDDPKADKNNPETFRKFLKEQPGLTQEVFSSGEAYGTTRRPYQVSQPTEVKNHGFKTGNADALRYEVLVDGKTIPVYMPKNPNPNEKYHTVDEVAKGLAGLPAQSLTSIETVTVNPDRNPKSKDTYMSVNGQGNVVIYPQSDEPGQNSLDLALVHETAHIISKRMWGEAENNSRTKEDVFGKTSWRLWEKAKDKDGISPSEYAKTSSEEDFAETFVLYMQVKGTPKEAELRAIMPERFKILDEITK